LTRARFERFLRDEPVAACRDGSDFRHDRGHLLSPVPLQKRLMASVPIRPSRVERTHRS
jgi:hypothetical protein